MQACKCSEYHYIFTLTKNNCKYLYLLNGNAMVLFDYHLHKPWCLLVAPK